MIAKLSKLNRRECSDVPDPIKELESVAERERALATDLARAEQKE